MKYTILFLISFVIISCNNSYNSENVKKDASTLFNDIKTFEDSINKANLLKVNKGNISSEDETLNSRHLNSIKDLDSLFKYTDVFPIKIDSLFNMGDIGEDYPILHYKAIRLLGTNNKDLPNSSSMDWLIETAITIDSVKLAGRYDNFLQETPCFDPQDIVAYALLSFKIDGTKCYLWAADYFTGDCCPHSRGSEILITFTKNESVLVNYCIAGTSDGGDPPMWEVSEDYVAISKDGLFEFNRINILTEDSQETGEQIVNRTTKSFNLRWDGEVLKEIEAIK